MTERSGTPRATVRRHGAKPKDEAARFWALVNVGGDDQCWEWTGCKSRGYGYFRTAEKVVRAPGYSWRLAHGRPVPEGLYVLHSCDNPPCVNPAHLSVGTQRENVRDMVERGRLYNPTHCPQGHAYDEANTYIPPRGRRECRTCKRARNNEAYAARRRATGA